jgi:ADP-ribose pyrophosphatase
MKKLIPADANLIPSSAVRVFEGELFDVYQWQQEMFDGSLRTYENLRRADTAIVIGIVDEKIVIIKDTQPHKGTRYVFPGGRVDSNLDDSTLAAAQREIREETGYEFDTWKLVLVEKPESKLEHFVYMYVATNPISLSRQTLDAGGEKIEVQLASYDEALEMMSGKLGEPTEHAFLEKARSLEGLLQLPEFNGVEVDIPAK